MPLRLVKGLLVLVVACAGLGGLVWAISRIPDGLETSPNAPPVTPMPTWPPSRTDVILNPETIEKSAVFMAGPYIVGEKWPLAWGLQFSSFTIAEVESNGDKGVTVTLATTGAPFKKYSLSRSVTNLDGSKTDLYGFQGTDAKASSTVRVFVPAKSMIQYGSSGKFGETGKGSDMQFLLQLGKAAYDFSVPANDARNRRSIDEFLTCWASSCPQLDFTANIMVIW